MDKEKDMGTLADDDINDRINAGRQTIEMSREEMEDDPYGPRVPPGVIAAGVGMALVGWAWSPGSSIAAGAGARWCSRSRPCCPSGCVSCVSLATYGCATSATCETTCSRG